MGKIITVALAGNPNTGKTTIFNALTGSHQKVGNYAGVTVDRREGRKRYRGYEFHIHDLPGTYSLTAYSLDEVVARDFILQEKPDVVIDVLDASHIERNLYLALQFQELHIPVISALNLNDEAIERGIHINEVQLSRILRMPFIKTVGTKGEGILALLDKAIDMVESKVPLTYGVSYGDELEEDVRAIMADLVRDEGFIRTYPPHWCTTKLLEKDPQAQKIIQGHTHYQLLNQTLQKCISRIEGHFGRDAAVVMAEQRYGYIRGAVAEAVVRKPVADKNPTERIDRLLLHRFWGFPFFLMILWLMFEITFRLGSYPMGWLETGFAWMAGAVSGILPEGFWNSLVVDGIISGVGGVLSFVPLIIILFLLISILEDTGYMARSAFIMDKFLHVFGLHGQSFLPMVLGFGCSVPAIMAARTLKSPRDRVITVLIIPFMSCGAKLPVYVLLAGAFFGVHAGGVVMLVYVIGILLAFFSAFLFRRTILKGSSTPFVMELPPYRMPTLEGILWHVREKTWRYLKKAGIVLLPASILIWAAISFPRMPISESMENKTAVEYSVAGRVGKFIEPVIAPLGFDWKIGISALTGFAAREMVVSTLGELYSVSSRDDGNEGLRAALRKDPVFTPLVAFVLMVFMLVIVPCFASLATLYAEVGIKWMLFAVCYWSLTAWGICLLIFQAGRVFGLA